MVFSINYYIASIILLLNQLEFTESSVNLAFQKNTSQSSNYNDNHYLSSNAVDGLHKYCVTTGLAHTQDRTKEWWQVDLGKMCKIKTIVIFHRTNHRNRMAGYALNITKSLNPLETWQCYKDEDLGLPYNSTQSHICPSLGRYVTFSRERATPDPEGDKAVINLCEVEVYGCQQGLYGNGSCNSYCSVGCLNSMCDPDNGHCNCSRYWSGSKCDEFYCSNDHDVHSGNCIPCSTGCRNNKCHFETGDCLDGCKSSFYEKFCNLTCPTNCYNTSCARDNGRCIGCTASFYGDKCEQKCKWTCKDKVCKQDDGYCTEGCKNAFFGDFCNKSCPANCKQNKCDRKTGDCSDGCRTDNFLGDRCNVCVNGMYSEECKMACPVNCKYSLCDGKDGICMFGCKHANMTGNQCDGIQTIKEELAFQISSYTGTIIAGVVSLINIVLIVVILILHCKRRRRKETVYENQKPLDCTQEGRNQQENYNMEQHQTVHYETLGLDDSGSVNTNFAEAYTGLNVNTEGRYQKEKLLEMHIFILYNI